ncbi:MAG: ABC transporter permease [Deinococcota bacterium]|nr:ABC transporter permease [Deinococcota bacterium]
MDRAGSDLTATQEERRPGALSRWWNAKSSKRFRRNPLAIIGVLISLAFLFVAIFAPQLTISADARSCVRDLGLSASTIDDVRNPLTGAFWQAIFVPLEHSCYTVPRTTFSPIPVGPAEGSIMGTTSGGYDIFYGLVWGTRTAFFIGLFVVGFGLVAGIFFGSIAGYFGGWVDNALMRFTDVVLALPSLVLALVLITVFGNSIFNLMLAIALTQWPSYARLLRGDILRVKEMEYVQGARALGARGPGIIFKHVLPNSISSLLVIASLDIGSVVLVAASLSFLGLGTPVGYADWGQMISFARQWIIGPPGDPFGYWFVSFWPGVTILLFVLGWNLLGDAFRDVFDPRSQ